MRQHVKEQHIGNEEEWGQRGLKNVPVCESDRSNGDGNQIATVILIRIAGHIGGLTLGNLESHMPGKRIG